MLFATIGQIHIFLWMIGAGLVVGALYTLFAWLRRLMAAGFWLTLAIDALFGLCAAVIMIAAILIAGYGDLRLYQLLGAVLGGILFELGILPPLEWLLNLTLARTKRIFLKITNFRLIKVIFH